MRCPDRYSFAVAGWNSEWAGSFTVTGTAADPQVQGSIQPVRGSFDFLGRRFVLDTGRIGVHGLQDITIDLTASFQRPDLRALILVSGTPSQPKITLHSEPELPQDEILARVLFNKSTGGLSIGEAAQLASAAAALASGEPGMLDKLRTVAGLDRLTLGSSQEEGGLGTVEAGKNISKNVYVGVEQGASATSTVVEVNITDNLKLRSTTTAKEKLSRVAVGMGLIDAGKGAHRAMKHRPPSSMPKTHLYGAVWCQGLERRCRASFCFDCLVFFFFF